MKKTMRSLYVIALLLLSAMFFNANAAEVIKLDFDPRGPLAMLRNSGAVKTQFGDSNVANLLSSVYDVNGNYLAPGTIASLKYPLFINTDAQAAPAQAKAIFAAENKLTAIERHELNAGRIYTSPKETYSVQAPTPAPASRPQPVAKNHQPAPKVSAVRQVVPPVVKKQPASKAVETKQSNKLQAPAEAQSTREKVIWTKLPPVQTIPTAPKTGGQDPAPVAMSVKVGTEQQLDLVPVRPEEVVMEYMLPPGGVELRMNAASSNSTLIKVKLRNKEGTKLGLKIGNRRTVYKIDPEEGFDLKAWMPTFIGVILVVGLLVAGYFVYASHNPAAGLLPKRRLPRTQSATSPPPTPIRGVKSITQVRVQSRNPFRLRGTR